MNVPNHIAFIMDGNGRWAKARLMPRSFGHKKGADAMKRVVNACIEEGVKVVTVYAFSTENWKRPEVEINTLFGMIKEFMSETIDKEFIKPIRVVWIGDREGVPSDVRQKIEDCERRTVNNDALTLGFAFNYGARDELIRAVNTLVQKCEAVDEKALSDALDTRLLPDPDVIVRTSGEQRLSNFLLYQSAYSELIFIDDLWPDMGKEQIRAIIKEFNNRNRRFGGV